MKCSLWGAGYTVQLQALLTVSDFRVKACHGHRRAVWPVSAHVGLGFMERCQCCEHAKNSPYPQGLKQVQELTSLPLGPQWVHVGLDL